MKQGALASALPTGHVENRAGHLLCAQGKQRWNRTGNDNPCVLGPSFSLWVPGPSFSLWVPTQSPTIPHLAYCPLAFACTFSFHLPTGNLLRARAFFLGTQVPTQGPRAHYPSIEPGRKRVPTRVPLVVSL